MARPLVLRFAGSELPFSLEKVDRSDLYGYVEVQTLDDLGRPCSVATLGADGQTLIGSGGSASAYLLPDGLWTRQQELRPVNPEGETLEPSPSSFSAPVDVEHRATVEELLDHVIRSVYLLNTPDDWGPLHAELAAGAIFTFPFSYRGGLNPETAFVLQSADGGVFMLVGSAGRVEFVGLAQTATPADEAEETEDEDDGLDFSMF